MPELASRTTLGGAVGDTNNGYVIHNVFADGIYGWKPQPPMAAVTMAAVSADMASRPAVGTTAEGFEVYVQTNRLTFVNRAGVYEPRSLRVFVADEADRDMLTEMIDKQQAYLSDQDSIDTYDLPNTVWKQGAATIVYDNYADITSPADYTVGDQIVITADADESLRGQYDVLGDVIGQPGMYIQPA